MTQISNDLKAKNLGCLIGLMIMAILSLISF
jgi:hypothetical protein